MTSPDQVAPGPVPLPNGTLIDKFARLATETAEGARRVIRQLRRVGTGTLALDVGTLIRLLDEAQNVIFAEDSSGVGMGLPWLPIPGVSVIGIPQTSTASYGPVFSSLGFVKRQPYASVAIYAQTQGGGAGNVRLTANGTPIGDVVPVAVNTTVTATVQTFALPGVIGASVQLSLEVQVTGGVGTIGGVFVATQRGTP